MAIIKTRESIAQPVYLHHALAARNLQVDHTDLATQSINNACTVQTKAMEEIGRTLLSASNPE